MQNYKVNFGENLIELFENMDKIREQYGLRKINAVVLLKGFLEEKHSLMYDFLCASTYSGDFYKQILNDCNKELEKIKETENEISQEKLYTVSMKFSESEKHDIFLDEDVNLLVYKTISDIFSERLKDSGELLDDNNLLADEAIEGLNLDVLMYSRDLLESFMDEVPANALQILRNNGVNIEAFWSYIELIDSIFDDYDSCNIGVGNLEENNNIISTTISDFVTIMSAKYKDVDECEILERDEECKAVMRILQKRGRKNVILTGEAGVGKSAVAEKIAFDIAHGNCPDALKDNVVLKLNVTSIISGTIYRGMAEQRFNYLVDYLEKNENVILFIDEIHMVIGAGATSGHDSGDMANSLKQFLASSKAKVIGATTYEEYERIVSSDFAFKRRFKVVNVKEPKSKQVYPMLRNAIKSHSEFHGVTISEEMVQAAVLYSACFNNTTRNPDRTNDLIDTAMVIAKEKGKTEVDKQDILDNFDIDFKKYKMMSYESKMSTAYHEAGHYLVWRIAGTRIDWKGIAVSIMPAEDYLGVTVYDDVSDEKTPEKDKEYFINELAEKLAGREAEKLYTHKISSGASGDLEHANKIAYSMVCYLGMGDEDSNITYIEDKNYHMLNERSIEEINKQRKILINKATARARDILNQNRPLLEKLVAELMEKGILDENDLERICSEFN